MKFDLFTGGQEIKRVIRQCEVLTFLAVIGLFSSHFFASITFNLAKGSSNFKIIKLA